MKEEQKQWYRELKNWPWKRIVLGAVIISSVAASSSFGTYAYFTSKAEEKSPFSAGTLEIRLGKSSAVFQADDDQPFMPGVRFVREWEVENESDVPVKYALLAEKAGGDDVVYDQLMVEIRRNGPEGELLYRGRVKQLTPANVVVDRLEVQASDTLHYTVYLPESTGNEVMGKAAEVEFGFLATQLENGTYFAQDGPVMTFTPDDFSRQHLEATKRVIEEAIEGTTFVFGTGEYTIPADWSFGKNITLKAAEMDNSGNASSTTQANQEQAENVVFRADGADAILRLKAARVEGITFAGRAESALKVASDVSVERCRFVGDFAAAVKTDEDESLRGITIKDNQFSHEGNGVVIDRESKAVMVQGNTFDGVQHAIVVDNDQATELQVVDNDFAQVASFAVNSNGVRIGDGIAGYRETKGEEGVSRLALHLQHLDIYLEGNRYAE